MKSSILVPKSGLKRRLYAKQVPDLQIKKDVNGRRWIATNKGDISKWVPEQLIKFNKKYPGTPKMSDKFNEGKQKTSVNTLFTFIPDRERKTYAKYFTEVVPKLAELDIITLIMVSPIDDGTFWYDYMEDDAFSDMEEMGIDGLTVSYIYPYLHCSENGKYILPNADPYINFTHQIKTRKLKVEVDKIFKEAFGAKYEWKNKSDSAGIIVNF